MINLTEGLLFDNRYELQRLVGRGGFAEVWLAKDTLSGIVEALKIYAPGGGMDENGLKMFVKELNVVHDLRHSNLLTPNQIAQWERMPYLLMQYCPNGSCNQLIENITEEEAWNLLSQVASGLSYLHKKGIVHQDIKPDNILIDANGEYVITDFGISMKAQSTLRKSTMLQTSGGTMAYMAPERFSADNRPRPTNDIWSLGAMMYELFEGDVPFMAQMGGLALLNGAQIPNMQSDISDKMKQTILSMLSKDEQARPTAEMLAKGHRNEPKIREDYTTVLINPVPQEDNSAEILKKCASDIDSNYLHAFLSDKISIPNAAKQLEKAYNSTTNTENKGRCAYFLAEIYDDKRYNIYNLETAISWYKSAIQLGCKEAYSGLAQKLSDKDSEHYDLAEAINFANEGIKHGDNFSYVILSGINLATDSKLAKQYAKKAVSSMGSFLAYTYLGFLEENESKRIDYWKSALESNSFERPYNVGYMSILLAQLVFDSDEPWELADKKNVDIYGLLTEGINDPYLASRALIDSFYADSLASGLFYTMLFLANRDSEYYNKDLALDYLHRIQSLKKCTDSDLLESTKDYITQLETDGYVNFGDETEIEETEIEEPGIDEPDEPEIEDPVDSSVKYPYTVGETVFNMTPVDWGTFTMGATPEQGLEVDNDERPQHQVTVGSFLIGETPVTQELWNTVMGYNPSSIKGDKYPVEQVSWETCQQFVDALNKLYEGQLGGKQFRLPTEAEWEYAARGGNKSKHYKYSGSNNLDEVAWYDKNSNLKIHPVKHKHPNELGLYDMNGNVWEWCLDGYCNYSDSYQSNPLGSSDDNKRVCRGGCYSSESKYSRLSSRKSLPQTNPYVHVGFRLVLSDVKLNAVEPKTTSSSEPTRSSQPTQPSEPIPQKPDLEVVDLQAKVISDRAVEFTLSVKLNNRNIPKFNSYISFERNGLAVYVKDENMVFGDSYQFKNDGRSDVYVHTYTVDLSQSDMQNADDGRISFDVNAILSSHLNSDKIMSDDVVEQYKFSIEHISHLFSHDEWKNIRRVR